MNFRMLKNVAISVIVNRAFAALLLIGVLCISDFSPLWICAEITFFFKTQEFMIGFVLLVIIIASSIEI